MNTGKKILVTGADGFIGSHLTEYLLNKGHQVRALSYYNSFNYWGWLNEIRHPGLEVVSGDVRDSFFCKKLVENVDQIYHLAALIAIPYSYHAPQSYIDTNVQGTLNICQAGLDKNVKVLHVSTSEVYGTAQYVPIDEKHPLQPQSPYSASKIAADAIALSHFYSFGLPVTIARPFNTFGPRQSARAVIPTIISQLQAGKKEIDLGDLAPTRDFNFVTNTCAGMYKLANCQEAVGQTVNLGAGFEITIGETFKLINQLMGSKAEVKIDNSRIRPANSEVQRLWCDNSLLKKLTGYQPEISFEDGIKKTINWFNDPKNLSNYKTNIYNI